MQNKMTSVTDIRHESDLNIHEYLHQWIPKWTVLPHSGYWTIQRADREKQSFGGRVRRVTDSAWTAKRPQIEKFGNH